MKRILTAIVAALTVFSFAGIARAIPATDNPDAAISVLENEHQGAKPAKKPVKKQTKARKPQQKQAAPASSQAPAKSSGSSAAPPTSQPPASK